MKLNRCPMGHWLGCVLAVAVLLLAGLVPATYAQTQLSLVHEIKLPVRSARGSYGTGFLLVGTPARQLFVSCLTRDQSLLVLNPDVSGTWLLSRIRNWSSSNPSIETLNIPGWNSDDAKFMGRELVDLQTTPDGRYALTVVGATWTEKGEGYIFFPKSYVARKPDAALTLIDLHRWQIVATVRNSSYDSMALEAARILNSRWIAMQGSGYKENSSGGSNKDHYSLRQLTRLISIPDLKPGPACAFKFNMPMGDLDEDHRSWHLENSANDAACKEVLTATGVSSVRQLESSIFFDRPLEPDPIRIHRFQLSPVISEGERTDENVIEHAEPFFRGPFRTDDFRNEIYSDNLPYQDNGKWYALYDSPERGLYS